MNNKYKFLFALLVLSVPYGLVYAKDSVTVKDAWIADAPPIAKIRAAYLTLHNQGNHTVSVKSISSPDFAKVELHKTVVAAGMVKMEEVKHLSIEAGKSVEFKPGGYHLMLFNPTHKLTKGDKVKFKLELQNNMTTSFTAVVRKRDSGNMHEHQHKCGGGKCGGK